MRHVFEIAEVALRSVALRRARPRSTSCGTMFEIAEIAPRRHRRLSCPLEYRRIQTPDAARI
jgi:hypothetical protein